MQKLLGSYMPCVIISRQEAAGSSRKKLSPSSGGAKLMYYNFKILFQANFFGYELSMEIGAAKRCTCS